MDEHLLETNLYIFISLIVNSRSLNYSGLCVIHEKVQALQTPQIKLFIKTKFIRSNVFFHEILNSYLGIRETAVIVNFQLMKLVESGEGGEATEGGGGEADEGGEGGAQLELDGVVAVLTQMLHHSSVSTKVAALDWILHLYSKLPAQVL